MIYICLTAISLVLLVVQTAVMPIFPIFDNFYDLIVPLVIYIGLRFSIKEGFLFVCLLGLLSDTMSGGPFGIFTTVYVWLFSATNWLFTFLQVRNNLLAPFFVPAGVFMENCLFMGIFFLLNPEFVYPVNTIEIVLGQTMWALFTGPPLLLAINFCVKKWNLMTSFVFAG